MAPSHAECPLQVQPVRHLCFWPTGCKSDVPMTFSGSVNWLQHLTELREDCQFVVQGHDSGPVRWERCPGPGRWGRASCPAPTSFLSFTATFPERIVCNQSPLPLLPASLSIPNSLSSSPLHGDSSCPPLEGHPAASCPILWSVLVLFPAMRAVFDAAEGPFLHGTPSLGSPSNLLTTSVHSSPLRPPPQHRTTQGPALGPLPTHSRAQ